MPVEGEIEPVLNKRWRCRSVPLPDSKLSSEAQPLAIGLEIERIVVCGKSYDKPTLSPAIVTSIVAPRVISNPQLRATLTPFEQVDEEEEEEEERLRLLLFDGDLVLLNRRLQLLQPQLLQAGVHGRPVPQNTSQLV